MQGKNNISGFSLIININASVTFPTGIVITQLASDSDPFDIPSIQIGDGQIGLNGDATYWAKPQLLKITLNIIPNGDDDRLLSILFNANRVQKGKQSARDIITMTPVYGDGTKATLTNGIISDGMPSLSIAGEGKFKTKAYSFMFGGIQ
jgi:hypothetical protein